MDDSDLRASQVMERIESAFKDIGAIEVEDGPGVAKALAAYGWWARIVRTGRAIVILHRQGLAHEAAPLVRTLLHHSAALIWLDEFPDEALEALRWEHQKQGSKMLAKAIERSWDLDPIGLVESPTDEKPAGYRYLQQTEELCCRAGLDHLYVAFLIESKFTHPTGLSADAYLAVVGDELVLLKEPPVHTPLRGAVVFAAESTRRFCAMVGRDDLGDPIAEMAESLASQEQ
jgi:hypothetical protein